MFLHITRMGVYGPCSVAIVGTGVPCRLAEEREEWLFLSAFSKIGKMLTPGTAFISRQDEVNKMRRRALLIAAACASVVMSGPISADTGKQIHTTDGVYPAIGPYSQMVQAGNLIFMAGVIPLNKEGKAVEGTTIEEQTRLVLGYIGEKLKSQGLGFEHVVMSNVYMKDLNDFAKMNAIYGEHFKEQPPARATVEVSRLPRDVLIEIAIVAAKP